ETRTKPPGITRYPSRLRARNSRSVNGRGSSRPLRQTGVVESVTASLATKSMPRWVICSRMRVRSSGSSIVPRTSRRSPWPGSSPRKADAITISSSRSMISSLARAWPSHHVATLGSARSSPSTVGASAGRKLNSARASTTPEPSALAITTVPSRTACTKPGTPSSRTRVKLERIGEAGVQPPHQYFGALEAGHRADEDAIVAHGQILAFDQQEAEIARKISVLEISLIHGPGREHADPRIILPIKRGKLGLKSLEERRQALDLEPGIPLGHGARQRGGFSERIPGARGRLGAVAEPPPMAIGRPPDIYGINPQMRAACRRDPDQRPQEFRIARDDDRRQPALT